MAAHAHSNMHTYRNRHMQTRTYKHRHEQVQTHIHMQTQKDTIHRYKRTPTTHTMFTYPRFVECLSKREFPPFFKLSILQHVHRLVHEFAGLHARTEPIIAEHVCANRNADKQFRCAFGRLFHDEVRTPRVIVSAYLTAQPLDLLVNLCEQKRRVLAYSTDIYEYY